MNIPNLPTDNLYKFLAMAGFVLGVLSIGLLVFRLDSDAIELAKLETAYENLTRLDLERERQSDARILLLEEQLDLGTLLDQVEAGTISKEEAVQRQKENWRVVRESQRDEAAQRDARVLKFLEDLAELRINTSALGASVDTTALISAPLLVIGIIGFAVSGLGFLMWYYRLQRYQDQLVQAEAAKAKAEGAVHST